MQLKAKQNEEIHLGLLLRTILTDLPLPSFGALPTLLSLINTSPPANKQFLEESALTAGPGREPQAWRLSRTAELPPWQNCSSAALIGNAATRTPTHPCLVSESTCDLGPVLTILISL